MPELERERDESQCLEAVQRDSNLALIDRVRDAIAEDARMARKACWRPGRGPNAKPAHWHAYREGGNDGWAIESADGEISFIVGEPEALAAHIARQDPARVLRQVAAMRKILDCYASLDWYETDNALAKMPDPGQLLAALAEALGIQP